MGRIQLDGAMAYFTALAGAQIEAAGQPRLQACKERTMREQKPAIRGSAWDDRLIPPEAMSSRMAAQGAYSSGMRLRWSNIGFRIAK